MSTGLHVKYPLFLSDFNEIWTFSTDFRKILKYKVSRKSVQWEPCCSMRTDIRTNMTQLLATLRKHLKDQSNDLYTSTCHSETRNNAENVRTSLRNQSTNRITYNCHLQFPMKQKQSRSTYRKVENMKFNRIYYKRTYNLESSMPRVFNGITFVVLQTSYNQPF
jgi:hypothetical protein